MCAAWLFYYGCTKGSSHDLDIDYQGLLVELLALINKISLKSMWNKNFIYILVGTIQIIDVDYIDIC